MLCFILLAVCFADSGSEEDWVAGVNGGLQSPAINSASMEGQGGRRRTYTAPGMLTSHPTFTYMCNSRSTRVASGITMDQCWSLCLADAGCKAAEYWGGNGYCFFCPNDQTSATIRHYGNTADSGYPVYVLGPAFPWQYNADCQGSFPACTSACESAGDRVWTQITPQLGTGAACPMAEDCEDGDGECVFNIDCEGSYSACTSACESANDRVWTETQAQHGAGAACPEAEDCVYGDGGCVNTVVQQLKSLCDSPHTKQKWGEARHFSLKQLRQQCSSFHFRKAVRHLRTKLRRGTKKVDNNHWNRFCANVYRIESVFAERCM